MLDHEFTYGNHFKYGYNGEWFNKRESERDVYMTKFGKIEREPNSFLEECYDVARKIFDYSIMKDASVDLMFSGGSESEMMVRSFTDQNLPINIHIMVYDNHKNLHDIAHAITFCERNNLDYVIHELDAEKFIMEKGLLYASFSQCITPRMLPHMWLMQQLKGGVVVMGMGECYISHKNVKQYYDYKDGQIIRNSKNDYETAPWYFYEREKINSWYRFAEREGIMAIPGFFQYTPEIMLAFLEENLTKELVECQHWGKLSNTSTKLQIYEKYFPNLMQKYKKDGFEMLLHLDSQLRPELQKEYGWYSQEYKIEYNELVRKLRHG